MEKEKTLIMIPCLMFTIGHERKGKEEIHYGAFCLLGSVSNKLLSILNSSPVSHVI